MKFWQKVFLFSFFLFIITFNGTNIYIIEKKYTAFMDNEIRRTLAEQASFYSGLQASNPLFKRLKMYVKTIEPDANLLQTYVSTFFQKNKKNDSYVEIVNPNGQIVYSNVPFKMSNDRAEMQDLKPNIRQYIIRDMNEKTYIFISNIIDFENEGYYLSYIRDLSHVKAERQQEYKWFLQIDIVACFIFMIMLYFVSSYITRPINLLIEATKRISKGHFSEKVHIQSKDEFALLAKHFNMMSDVVEDKLNELQRNNEEKQRFIDNLTHELKTPLTSIIGYADLLRTTKYDERVFNEGLNYIYSEGKRLEELAFNLMGLLERRDAAHFREESILDVIFHIKGAITPFLNEKGITLQISGDDFIVNIERELMNILLTNIINNSIKASDNNGNIEVICNAEKKSVAIKDYGIGIAEEHISQLFEPFYMVNKARTRSKNGAGLGLAICKRIMDIHQGTIRIESKENEGTVVLISF
ncbi:sensor histidine kinase [Bacillus massiliigorillae]|uniref:sensor histidine kinase n=1 Tax=Bacillus massiliigorillae TaxID=1243664 RepID=UPI0003A10092|nr:HAMP domain-containing sensor histidine kinase [Bacillus massiliigorillae]